MIGLYYKNIWYRRILCLVICLIVICTSFLIQHQQAHALVFLAPLVAAVMEMTIEQLIIAAGVTFITVDGIHGMYDAWKGNTPDSVIAELANAILNKVDGTILISRAVYDSVKAYLAIQFPGQGYSNYSIYYQVPSDMPSYIPDTTNRQLSFYYVNCIGQLIGIYSNDNIYGKLESNGLRVCNASSAYGATYYTWCNGITSGKQTMLASGQYLWTGSSYTGNVVKTIYNNGGSGATGFLTVNTLPYAANKTSDFVNVNTHTRAILYPTGTGTNGDFTQMDLVRKQQTFIGQTVSDISNQAITAYTPVVTSVTTSVASPQMVGGVVNIYGTAAHAVDQRFRFTIYDYTTRVTQLLHDYSTANVCEWYPTKSGNYKLTVDCKSATSVNAYDSTLSIDYTITANPAIVDPNSTAYLANWTGTFNACSEAAGVYGFEGVGTITGSMDMSRAGTWEGEWSTTVTGERVWSGTFTNTLSQTWSGTATESLTSTPDVPFDYPNYIPPAGITTKFPFSIPWDLSNAISGLLVTPQAPVWTIDFPDNIFIGGGQVVLDMSKFEVWAKVIRWGILIMFNVFLILATRRMIGAGG